jgi:hypothetical protein
MQARYSQRLAVEGLVMLEQMPLARGDCLIFHSPVVF